MVITENSINRFTAEEQNDAPLNLAVPSPIFKETEPILAAFLRREEKRRKRVNCVRFSENEQVGVREELIN